MGDQPVHHEIRAGEFGDHGATVEDQGTVADLGDLLEIRTDDDDRGACGGGLGEKPVDLAARADIDAGRRVLEDEQPCALIEPAADHDFLLIAAGALGLSPTFAPSDAARRFSARGGCSETGRMPWA